MEQLQTEEQINAATELEALLQYNGFAFHREGERFFLVFADKGCKWETLCVCRGSLVLIYGRYPFPVLDAARVQVICENINRQVVQGSMFLSDGHIVFRTGADLFDAYNAYESIGRALEYNASVITYFWQQAASCVSTE